MITFSLRLNWVGWWTLEVTSTCPLASVHVTLSVLMQRVGRIELSLRTQVQVFGAERSSPGTCSQMTERL